MVKIRWTAESEKWMREIYDYIAQDNERAAQRVIAGVYEKVQILKDFPEIGYKYRSELEGEITNSSTNDHHPNPIGLHLCWER